MIQMKFEKLRLHGKLFRLFLFSFIAHLLNELCVAPFLSRSAVLFIITSKR